MDSLINEKNILTCAEKDLTTRIKVTCSLSVIYLNYTNSSHQILLFSN